MFGMRRREFVAVVGGASSTSRLQNRSASTFHGRCSPRTLTPAGKALFQMMGVFAEFERLLAIKSMGDESTKAWRTVLDDRHRPQRHCGFVAFVSLFDVWRAVGVRHVQLLQRRGRAVGIRLDDPGAGIKAGIARAKAQGKHCGRPRLKPQTGAGHP
jgi:hypothetical protein